MLSIIKKTTLFLFLSVLAINCSDDQTNDFDYQTGTFEMKINDTTWTATQAEAYAGAANDSSALVLSASRVIEAANEFSYLTVFAINTTSKNLVGVYPLVPEDLEEQEEVTVTKGAFILFMDNQGVFWISTAGTFEVTKSSSSIIEGVFQGTLTSMDFETEEQITVAQIAAKKSLPKFTLRERQLNTTVTLSAGKFNLNYGDFDDIEE